MKDIKKDLRELRKSSSLAVEILKVLSAGHDSSIAVSLSIQKVENILIVHTLLSVLFSYLKRIKNK
jgi:hypothetical protein